MSTLFKKTPCGKYLVGEFGEVRRVKDFKIIKPYVHKNRNIFYLRVAFGGKQHLVHKLVGETWHGKAPQGYQWSHLDGNPFNCWRHNVVAQPASVNQGEKRKPLKTNHRILE